VPDAIALYLVWWLTTWVGAKLDRVILAARADRSLRVGF